MSATDLTLIGITALIWGGLIVLVGWGLRRLAPALGATPAIRVVALGVSAAIFPLTIRALLSAPFVFVRDVLAAFDSAGGGEGLGAYRDLTTVLEGGFGWLAESPAIGQVPFLLAVWVIAGQGLSALTRGPGQPTLWTRLSTLQRRQAGLAGLLLIGAYLCTVSMVAVPYMAEGEPLLEDERERVLGRNEATLLQVKAAAPVHYPGAAYDTLGVVGSTAVEIPALTDAAERFGAPSDGPRALQLAAERARDRFNLWGAQIASERLSRHQRWERARREALELTARLSRDIESQVDVHRETPMNRHDRVRYHQALLAAKNDALRPTLRRLGTLQEAYIRADQIEDTAIREAADRLHEAIEDALAPLDTAGVSGAVTFESPVVPYPDEPPVPSGLDDYSSLAGALPDPGSDWGSFGWMARWLLATRSLPLTLLCGMFGFGILGATVSTFVQTEGRAATREGEAPHGLLGITVRGLSAALVVFLAVQGGLTVFSLDDSEPNAYALFFACLAAAVYSDSVWERVRQSVEKDAAAEAAAEDALPPDIAPDLSPDGDARPPEP